MPGKLAGSIFDAKRQFEVSLKEVLLAHFPPDTYVGDPTVCLHGQKSAVEAAALTEQASNRRLACFPHHTYRGFLSEFSFPYSLFRSLPPKEQ